MGVSRLETSRQSCKWINQRLKILILPTCRASQKDNRKIVTKQTWQVIFLTIPLPSRWALQTRCKIASTVSRLPIKATSNGRMAWIIRKSSPKKTTVVPAPWRCPWRKTMRGHNRAIVKIRANLSWLWPLTMASRRDFYRHRNRLRSDIQIRVTKVPCQANPPRRRPLRGLRSRSTSVYLSVCSARTAVRQSWPKWPVRGPEAKFASLAYCVYSSWYCGPAPTTSGITLTTWTIIIRVATVTAELRRITQAKPTNSTRRPVNNRKKKMQGKVVRAAAAIRFPAPLLSSTSQSRRRRKIRVIKVQANHRWAGIIQTVPE